MYSRCSGHASKQTNKIIMHWMQKFMLKFSPEEFLKLLRHKAALSVVHLWEQQQQQQ